MGQGKVMDEKRRRLVANQESNQFVGHRPKIKQIPQVVAIAVIKL
jgi:hypothetical protein